MLRTMHNTRWGDIHIHIHIHIRRININNISSNLIRNTNSGNVLAVSNVLLL